MVEQVEIEAWLRIIVGNPFPDGLPGGVRLEAAGGRLEGSASSQSAEKSIEDLGGFGSDRNEFHMPRSAEESEPVREPDLVFDLAG